MKTVVAMAASSVVLLAAWMAASLVAEMGALTDAHSAGCLADK